VSFSPNTLDIVLQVAKRSRRWYASGIRFVWNLRNFGKKSSKRWL